MVAPQVQMGARPTKVSSHLQQKSKIATNSLQKHSPTVNIKKAAKKSQNPTKIIRKSTLAKPKSKHVRGKKKSEQEMKIVHNLDGKTGKNNLLLTHLLALL